MTDDAFPIISVRDLAAVRTFYERLGFSQAFQFPPEGEPEFVTMERGTSSIGIGTRRSPDEERFAYWVYVGDVDAALERVKEAGAPVVADPEDQPWGERVASVRDPDGNLIHLGAPIP